MTQQYGVSDDRIASRIVSTLPRAELDVGGETMLVEFQAWFETGSSEDLPGTSRFMTCRCLSTGIVTY